MFLGLTDKFGAPIWPEVVSRIAVEVVVWDCLYVGPNRFEFTNRNRLSFWVHKPFREYAGIAFFREADDVTSVTPPVRMIGNPQPLNVGDEVRFESGMFRLSTSVVMDSAFLLLK